MKKVLVVLIFIFFTACEKNAENFDFPIQKIPTQILLYNQNYTPAGIAIPISDDVFVAPNSIFKLDENLFWRNNKTKILIRDFSTDLIFFELKNGNFFSANFSDTPPAVGQTLFRFIDGEVLGLKVLSVADDVDRFTVEGEMEKMKDFGAPIFDKEGKIYGIFIGGIPKDSTLTFLRSDKILELFDESFDEKK